MELLIFLGLIVMELLAVTSENLPPPHLSLMTSGTIYMGDTVELQCAAPANHPEGTFYLYLNSTGQCLQQKAAPETKNIVKFTISSPYTMKSMEYSCMYKSYVGSELQLSEVSNVLSLTVNVPVWVFVLVGLVGLLILVAAVLVTYLVRRIPVWVFVLVGLVGLLILVAAVLVTYLVRRSKKKKKEQRIPPPTLTPHMTIRETWILGHIVGHSHHSAPSEPHKPEASSALVTTVTSNTWNLNYGLMVEESERSPLWSTRCRAVLLYHRFLCRSAFIVFINGPSTTYGTLYLKNLCVFCVFVIIDVKFLHHS
ncbi:unnamed protein product [Ranitomeya imitator]|uniref:C19orf38 Ig domain-containing protein n=1 Tax=Ranitomeya imitator TaxID=111125 RepID=A0ABN9LA89_9NEOB|nr:unnamed protein product [Ranitomeya imitator]